MPRPKLTIGVKLTLLALVMLSIPYVNFQYLRATERYLQSSLENGLLAAAGALAASLRDQASLFRHGRGTLNNEEALFVHTLDYPIHIDAYTDDWEGYREWGDRFTARQTGTADGGVNDAFDLVIAEYGQELFVLVEVSDDSHVYQTAGSYRPDSADTIELLLDDNGPRARSVYLSTATPGPVTGYHVVENWDFTTSQQPVANITGQWRETPQGFTVEIRVPRAVAARALGVRWHDRDRGREDVVTVASSEPGASPKPNDLIRTSAQLQRAITRLGTKPGRRAWVLNHSGQVLASGGSLRSKIKRGAINFLYTWVLPTASDRFEDDLHAASRLRGEDVLRALGGQSAARWRSSPDERAVIVSAAHPVRSGNEIVGAVVIEETTNSIQTLQREAMAALYNRSIAVFLGVLLILLVFASRLSMRIANLRDQADRAIDAHGRVVGTISRSRARDEIGDLSRSYAAMLARLRDYNAYLESMASKLSHELRTPLAVVSSSLQNLDTLCSDAEQQRYLVRARDGTERLQQLVRRLSEAARIEQSIASAAFELFDLSELLSACIDGYRQAYPDVAFAWQCDAGDYVFMGSADLIAQLLDKLIDNAVAFTTASEPIRLRLCRRDQDFLLTVSNHGPQLPDKMRRELFNSMISVAGVRDDNQPHLGLGLFIARLIAETHGGEIFAENLRSGDGVVVTLRLPQRCD